MWCHDVGREQGSGKQLLRTVLQVNLKLFRPEVGGAGAGKRKTRLLFVLRDRTKTPLDKLREVLQDDLAKMWAGMSKPAGYEAASLEDFFELDYLSLPNFDLLPEEFEREAGELRDQLAAWAHANVAPQFQVPGVRIPASALSVHMGKAWEVIRADRDLNLPAHRVMVSNIRCEEIAAASREAALQGAGSAWPALAQETRVGRVGDFGPRARAIVEGALEAYDAESACFDPNVRAVKREGLAKALVADMMPSVRAQAKLLAASYLERLSSTLEAEQAKSVPLSRRTSAVPAGAASSLVEVFAPFRPFPLARVAEATLPDLVESFSREASDQYLVEHESQELRDLVAEASTDLSARMQDLVDALRGQLVSAATAGIRTAAMRQYLAPQVAVLLDKADPVATWRGIRTSTAECMSRAGRVLRESLGALGMPPAQVQAEAADLEAAVLDSVRGQCREAAASCQHRMRDRFLEKFNYDAQGLPRNWAPGEDIPRAALEAKVAASGVLATFAVMRWAETMGEGARRPDIVQRSLCLLADPETLTPASHEAISGGSMCDTATSLAWPSECLAEELGIAEPLRDVVLSPQECKRAWDSFKAEVNVVVVQAQNAQQTALMAGSRGSLPLWVYVVFFILGWNEFKAVVFNPLLLTIILVLGLFVFTLYQELDVDRELQRGLLPGALSLAGKFPSALGNVREKLVASAADTLRRAVESKVQDLQQGSSSVEATELRPLPSESICSTSRAVEQLRQRARAGEVEMSPVGTSSGTAAASKVGDDDTLSSSTSTAAGGRGKRGKKAE